MCENLVEKRKSGERLFTGRIVSVECDTVILPDGNEALREVVRKNGGVCVVPLTDDGDVIVVKQYRYPYAKIVTEVPAGKMEKGEEPLECALRELSEETGYDAGKIISLGVFYPSPGIMDETLYMYLASELKKGNGHPDEDEFLQGERIPLEKLVDMIMSGEICDGKTQAAVLKVWNMKNKGEI